MFNFFKNQKNKSNEVRSNPVSVVYSNLTKNQRMSVINIIMTLQSVAGTSGVTEETTKYINQYLYMLDVRFDECREYLKMNNTVSDLKSLSLEQKEFIFTALWEIITISGRPSQETLTTFAQMFPALGITDEAYVKGFFEKLKLIEGMSREG